VETLTRAVAGIDRFRWGPAGFDGWVFGIARHVCTDHHRASHRFRLFAAKPEPPGIVALPGEALERAAEHDQMRLVFAQLPAADRELLELRVMAGLSSEQTAAVLGRTPGAVRTAQSRALARLRQLLEEREQ
jgi:RNA polymerase sigma-70 factor (ECF subfamily)